MFYFAGSKDASQPICEKVGKLSTIRTILLNNFIEAHQFDNGQPGQFCMCNTRNIHFDSWYIHCYKYQDTFIYNHILCVNS